MFDGAAVATAGAVTAEQSAHSQAEASSSDGSAAADTIPAAPTGEPQFTTDEQALFDALAAYDTSAARQEIVFVSSSVLEYQQLLDGISPNVEVIILDPARDGIEQMAEALAGRTGIDAIHLIGHGTEAEIQLGASSLTQSSIDTQYAEQLQQIGGSLSTEADILIYGCNFGQGEAGQAAIQTLAALTGADVAASTDATGHVELGGDWNLEAQTGSIEAQIAIDQAAQDNWSDLLGVVDWDSLTWTAGATAPVSQILTLSDGSNVTVTVTESATGTLNGITTANTYTGGLSPVQDALQFGMNIKSPTDTITVRIDFSNQLGGSVNNISLTLFDVDNNEFAIFNSNVGNPTSATTSTTNTFNGTNTVSGNGIGANANTGAGNTTITFGKSGITWVEFTYGSTSNASPVVVLHDILFNSTIAGGPTLDLNDNDASQSASDNFDDTAPFTAAYNNVSGGSIPWSTNWIEVDGGAAQSPTAGEVRVVDADATAGVDGELQIGGGSIQRSVNLTNYVNPTLSFNYRTSGTLEAGDTLVVEVSKDAGVTFTTLQTFTDDSTGTANLNLAGHESADTIIRFRVTGGYTAADEFLFVDNVTISAEPTGHTAAYTEGGSAVGISDSDVVITDASSVNMSGGTVAIANFVSGDTLTFTNTGNITGSYNALTGVLTISGVDTRANYQTFISSIRYSSTSDNPTVGGTMTTRTISTVVRDQTTQLPSNTAFTTVTITAVNDAPDIVNATVSLNENSANGTAVYNVNDSFTGTDFDREGTAISYSITGGNTGGAFAINPATGQITVNSSAVLNRESISSFTLTVQASDGTLTDTATITINLNDVDEFDVGAITDTNGGTNAVNENAATGTLVGITASASDADATNNTITYSLTDNAGGRFQIDGTTGVVTVLNGGLLNYESASSHNITVRADSVDGSFSTQTHTINVNNVNEAPVLGGDVSVTVAENSTAVGTFAATDVDAGDTVTYGLSGANAGLFTISAAGVVSFVTAPDYETNPGPFTFIVTATDVLGLTDTQTVTVSVTNVNEAPVNVVPGPQAVAEDTALVIGGVSVTDVDGNLSTTQLSVGNGTVTVSLAGGATISAGANGTGTLTLAGTQAQINAALATISYQGNLNFTGADTLTVTSTDSNAVVDTDTVAITVT
ncbi:MAG: DUF4347 domain-containing protein, partial [Nitrospira sp.]|nr:DUF4347 domain-containing protein [Nitrospira sp.]